MRNSLNKYFLILFLFIFIKSQAQNYFSNRYDVYGSIDIGGSIIATDSLLYVLANAYDSSGSYRTMFYKLDTNGILSYNNYYKQNGWNTGAGGPGSLQILDSGFAYAGSQFIFSGANLAALIKINFDGDTIWTKQYGDTINFYTAFQCKQTPDGGYIIVGAMDNGSSTQALLIKTDSLGNKLWEQNYGGVGEEYGFTVQLSPDGGFLVGGSTTSIGAGDIDAWIFKTDSLGNFQWQKTYGNNFEDCPAYLGKSLGNYYIFCGCQRYNTSASGKPRIVKLDLNGNTIWDTVYFNASNSTALHSIKELSTGEFVAVGTKGNSMNKLEGLVMKVNQNGNLIWKRTPVKLTGINSPNVLYDFDFSTNNSIIGTGFVSPASPDTGTQDIWVIKLDDWGCDTLGCQTVGLDELEEEKVEVKVYPNPTTGIFTLEYSLPDNFNESVFEVYDITGRTIISCILLGRHGHITPNLNFTPSGMYFYCIKNANKILGNGKLILAR